MNHFEWQNKQFEFNFYLTKEYLVYLDIRWVELDDVSGRNEIKQEFITVVLTWNVKI
jgi:hypothetical protein